MNRIELESNPSLNESTKKAGEIIAGRFLEIFTNGAEINSSEVVGYPQPQEADPDLEETLKRRHIAEVHRLLLNGNKRASYIIENGADRYLAVKRGSKSSQVELVGLPERGIVISTPLFNNNILMQGLKAESERVIAESGIKKADVQLQPLTLVKKALLKIAKKNGTVDEVIEKLMPEEKAGQENEWKR